MAKVASSSGFCLLELPSKGALSTPTSAHFHHNIGLGLGLACVHTPLLLSLSPTALPSGQPRPHPWAVGSPDPTVHIPAVSRPSHFPPTPPTPPKTRRNAPLPSPIHPNPSIPPIFSSHFSPPPLLLLLPAEATRGRERGEGRGRGSPLPPPSLAADRRSGRRDDPRREQPARSPEAVL
ncbi:hypothetical protein DAI22_04g032950 [Oryza sativa Japonica Group]|nr:hypothetical protein DAI22_04g032950 [Oryza sativa Japonica Group]